MTERRVNYHPELYDEVDRSLLVEYPRSYPLICYREFIAHLRRHYRVEPNDPISYIDDTGEEVFIDSEEDFAQALQLAFNYRKTGKAVIMLVDKFDLRFPYCCSSEWRHAFDRLCTRPANYGFPFSPSYSGTGTGTSDDSESSMSENESKNEAKSRKNGTKEPPRWEQDQPTPSTSRAALGRSKRKEEKKKAAAEKERKRVAMEEEKKRAEAEEKKKAEEEERKRMNDYYYGRIKTVEPREEKVELNQNIPAQVLLKLFEKKIQYIDEEIKKITARRDRREPYVATESDVEEEELPDNVWMQMSQEAIQLRKYNTRIRHLKLRKKETEDTKEICQVLMNNVDQHEKESEVQEVFTERYDLPENKNVPILHGRNLLECGNCCRKTSGDNEVEDSQDDAKSKDNGVRITCYISFPEKKSEQSKVNCVDASVASASFSVVEGEDDFELAHRHRYVRPHIRDMEWRSKQQEIDEDKFGDGQDSPSFELVSESPSPAKSINFNDEHLTQENAEESPMKILNDVDTDESSSWAEISYSEDQPYSNQRIFPEDATPHKTDDEYIIVQIGPVAKVQDSPNSMMKSSQTDIDDVKTSHSSYPTLAEMAELKLQEIAAAMRSCQSQTDSDDFAQSFHSHTTSVTDNDFYSGRKLAEDKQSSSIDESDKKEVQEPSASDKSPGSSDSPIQQPPTSGGSATQRKFEEVEIEELSDSVHILPETLVTGAASIASMAYSSARDVLGKLRAHTVIFQESQIDRAELPPGNVAQNRRFNFIDKIHPKIFLR